MALQDVRDLVASKIQDTAQKLTPSQIDDAISEAVTIYSAISPRHAMMLLTGDGVTVTYDLPTDWEDGFSWIERIEYPIGRQRPEYLDGNDDYTTDYRDPTTGELKLRFLSMTLSVNTQAAVDYALRHKLTETVSGEAGIETSPESDRPAIASLAGSICCQNLAAYYTNVSDSTIGADAVNYGVKGQEYATRAKELRAAFDQLMGLTGGLPAASAVQDLDVDLQNSWGDRFWHPGRYR